MAAELTGIWHVFQWHISIKNIYLIITKLGNHIDIGHKHTTTSFINIFHYLGWKVRSLKFAMFLPPPLQIASVHLVNRASWPRCWLPANDSCQVTYCCYHIAQRGFYDWWVGLVYSCFTHQLLVSILRVHTTQVTPKFTHASARALLS